jgi:hypothetical protein
MYKAMYKSYGTLSNLGKSGFISDPDLAAGSKGDYNYTCVAGANSYTIIAIPEDLEGNEIYRMTESGVLEIMQPGKSGFKPAN